MDSEASPFCIMATSAKEVLLEPGAAEEASCMRSGASIAGRGKTPRGRG